jgi:tetratricopeptide (TPR) repeat protein
MKKKLSVLLLLVGVGFSTFAQSDCETNYAVYRNEYKQKNYEEALKSWRKVFNECPSYNQNTFANGPKLYQDKIKKDKANKSAYVDTIMMIYDVRIEIFGKREYVLGLKGADLFKYDASRFNEAYEMLKTSVDFMWYETNPTVVVSYFKALDKVQRSSDFITKKDVLDAYVVVSDIVSYNIANNEKYAAHYEKSQKSIETTFAPYASCDDLIAIFSDRLETDGDNLSLLKKITSLLDKKNCTDNEVFYLAAEKLHILDPSASSAYDMGNTSLAKKQYSDAVKYFTQAIELQDDLDYKASYYLKLAYANQMKGSFSDARSAATKAANLKPEWGEPYLIIGDVYVASASKCGSSNLERGSVYWVAVDAFRKAKSLDDVLTEKANKRISTYSKYFPSKEDLFFDDLSAGDSYKVGCWIGRSTKVRTRD